MNKNTDGCIGIRILSPLTGTAVPLEEVPDPVFSQKIIGDGVAILPRDGNLVSPIDGEVVSIAETLHAYGLRSEDGIEVMVHFGLETVALKGECFQCCVKIGDKVKAGSLLAKADLKALEEKQVNTITPVLICGGMEGRSINAFTGPVKAGADTVITVLDHCPPDAAEEADAADAASPHNPDTAPAANTSSPADAADRKAGKPKKSLINFDFLQKLGKVLMTVIAVMPAAGLMISVGKLIQMAGGDMGAVLTIGSTMETIGWARNQQPAHPVRCCHRRLLGKGTGRRRFCGCHCLYPHQCYYRRSLWCQQRRLKRPCRRDPDPAGPGNPGKR